MSIDCERCGNCCPTTCEFLEVIDEEPRKTSCKIHEDETKPIYCSISPLRIYHYGIACRAILNILNETNIAIKIEPNGQRTFSRT